MATVELGTFHDAGGKNLAVLQTATGEYALVVQEGKGAIVLDPQGQEHAFAIPQIHVGALVAVGGELVVAYTAFLGYKPGTQTDNPDRPFRHFGTGIMCGAAATGTTAPAPPGGTVSAPVDLGPLITKLDALATAVDALRTDVVGRLKAHDEQTSAKLNAVQRGVDGLPAAVIGDKPAGDHFGLDPRARFDNEWQELDAYMWTQRQDFLQAVIERFFEAARNMQTEGFDPATGEYKKQGG